MKVTDPGPQYEYLSVEVDGAVFEVLKRNRAIRYSPFWITEPVMEEDKPDAGMTYAEIPRELWEVLNEEERLTVFLASAEKQNRQLKQKIETLKMYLFFAALITLSFVGAYLSYKFD
jgi:hypothetical protein